VPTRLLDLATGELNATQLREIRVLLDAAFGNDPDDSFMEEDWQHAIGGRHFILLSDDELVTHASVVERVLHVDGRPLRTGYVEAVATRPERQGQGFGTEVMRKVGSHVRAHFELGALGTSHHGFYERLGWRTWQGPSSVRTPDGERPTPDEDGYIMVLATPSSPPLDLGRSISCEWRPGDVW
jgi:aminoglycoside 2'-N-acetyltransferase I